VCPKRRVVRLLKDSPNSVAHNFDKQDSKKMTTQLFDKSVLIANGVRSEHCDIVFRHIYPDQPMEWDSERINNMAGEIAQFTYYLKHHDGFVQPKFEFPVCEDDDDDEDYVMEEEEEDKDDPEDLAEADEIDREEDEVDYFEHERLERTRGREYLASLSEDERAYYTNLYRLFYYAK
jgi:hypothetical protein